VLVLREAFIAQNRGVAEKFTELYRESGRYIGENRDSVYELTRKYLNISREVYDISLQWIAFDDLEIREVHYNDLVQRVRAAGLSENPPTYADFVDTTLLNPTVR
jgi:NitT/TauT family transport system substrate-binding protein